MWINAGNVSQHDFVSLSPTWLEMLKLSCKLPLSILLWHSCSQEDFFSHESRKSASSQEQKGSLEADWRLRRWILWSLLFSALHKMTLDESPCHPCVMQVWQSHALCLYWAQLNPFSWGFKSTLGRWVPSPPLILNGDTCASGVLEKPSL